MPRSDPPFSPERLLNALEKLPDTPCWWVAFSGGADSTALLLALSMLRDKLRAGVRALHVDHGLHPESAGWLAACERFCRDRNIPFHGATVEVPRDTGAGVEAEARRLRYAVAESVLAAGEILLTGHHADDQAETLLLNLMRGSGIDGLAGMPGVRKLGKGLLARPLLDVSGASLRAFLTRQGVGWIEDTSNLDEAYDRNFVRASLIPLLESRWPGVRGNLSASASYCREASEFLQQATLRTLTPCLASDSVLDLNCLAGRGLGGSDAPAMKLVIRRWLTLNNAPPLPSRRLEELMRQLSEAGESSAVEVRWQAWAIRRFRHRLWLQADACIQQCPERVWDTRQPLKLGPILGSLTLEHTAERACWTLSVRSRQPSDRLKCLTEGHSRTVKQVLQEAAVPPWLRASIPLVVDQGEVVAVADWIIAPGFRQRLNDAGLKLTWRPEDPALKTVVDSRPGNGG